MRIARSLFCSCDFSSWQDTTRPVGTCVMRTAESVVLTDWPPGPVERYTSMRMLVGVDDHLDLLGLGQHGHGGGRGVDAPGRLGHRHPLHPVHARLVLEMPYAPLPLTAKMISFKPPRGDSLVESTSTFNRRRSAYLVSMR